MSIPHSRLNQAILAALAHEDYFEDNCTSYSLEGADGRNRNSLTCHCKFDPSANLYASVPTVTSNIYVTISDGDPDLILQVLASIEDRESKTCVHWGDVIAFNDPSLRQHGIHAVMLLQGTLFTALAHLPETLVVDSKTYGFVSVIFLTQSDYDMWKTDGHDALMAHFQRIEKDVTSFG